MSIMVTSNFSVREFGCHDGTPYPVSQPDGHLPGSWFDRRLLPLCQTLEVIRDAGGGEAIKISSGYRTLRYDQQLYDADAGRGNVALPEGSQHPKGRAADIVHAKLKSSYLHALILELWYANKLPYLGGLGLYSSFVHVDVRPRMPASHLALWHGTRTTNVV